MTNTPSSADQAAAGDLTSARRIHAVLESLAGLLETVGDSRLADPTPCTDYSVAQLREHVVQWSAAFAAGFADPDGTTPDASTIEVHAGGSEQVRDAADILSDAVADGAARRPLRIGDSQLPGDMSLSMILWEYQVHGWDLARATGQSWSPAEDGLLASLDFAPGMLTADYQGEGKTFGPRVAVTQDAPPLDRLVGLSGRDPQWRAPH